MNCERAKAELGLLLYGELSFEDEERLQRHLDGCELCRLELARERSLLNLMDGAQADLPASLLQNARLDLSARLASEPVAKPSAWMRLTGRAAGWIDEARLSPARILRPAGALALVALGFFAGRSVSGPDYAPARASALGMTQAAQPVVARVRQVETDADGSLRIVVDETRQRLISGHADDDAIRKLLLAATTDSSDPGLRGKMCSMLAL